jgi:hypothetical protein
VWLHFSIVFVSLEISTKLFDWKNDNVFIFQKYFLYRHKFPVISNEPFWGLIFYSTYKINSLQNYRLEKGRLASNRDWHKITEEEEKSVFTWSNENIFTKVMGKLFQKTKSSNVQIIANLKFSMCNYWNSIETSHNKGGFQLQKWALKDSRYTQ